jgi:putative capsular polysaccharide biosynthesis protein
MIDMHCHIIPAIDDGSKSVTETFNMAIAAANMGYKGIFATPHYIEDRHETSCKDIENSVEVLNKMLKEKNIDLKIYVGNEIYICNNLLELLQENKVFTLGKSKYVLFELPFNGEVLNLKQIISELGHIGYIPILAHPERYEFIFNDYKKVIPLIEEGALIQINLASIVGYYGSKSQKCVEKLLKNNLVHFIGTDSHDSTSIYSNFEKAMKEISKKVSTDKLNEILVENPNRVLNDKPIY